MSEQDVTPDGDPIETHTIWLPFDNGEEVAISVDLTGWNAAMRRVKSTLNASPEERARLAAEVERLRRDVGR